MRIRLTAYVVGSCFAVIGSAGQAATTLQDALVSAYNNNPTLAAQRANLRATDELVSQARAGWRPNVSFSTDYGWQNVKTGGEGAALDRSQHREPNSYALTAEQPLFRGFRTVAGTERAKNQVLAGRARLQAAEQSVLFSAVQAFMNVVRDQAVLELNINNEQVLRRQLEAARDRFQVGEITRTDVAQAESRWVGATADRIQAEGNLEASRATYRNIVGEAPIDLVPPTPAAALPTDGEQAARMAVAANPNVVAAEYDEKASRENVRVVDGERLPTLSLRGDLSKGFQQSAEDVSQQIASARVVLSVPIYQQGAEYSRARQARETVAEDRHQIDVERRNAIQSATRAWEALQTVQARIRSLRSQIEAAQIALEGVQREAEVGSRTVLDVLDAEQELLIARVSLVTSQRDHVVAVYDVLSSVGQMTAQHLNLPVDYYDPQAHYDAVHDKWIGTGGDTK
jgi:outer membrane protein